MAFTMSTNLMLERLMMVNKKELYFFSRKNNKCCLHFYYIGTIEYTSRDAHIGAHSRRSDFEILGYNLVHWMSGDLPWLDVLTDPKAVQAKKNEYLKNVRNFLARCFNSQDYPGR